MLWLHGKSEADMSADVQVASSEHWGMPYEVWRRPNGTRYIKINPADVASQALQGVQLTEIMEIGDAEDASSVVAGPFRGSVWD
jgi:hypothetical protein